MKKNLFVLLFFIYQNSFGQLFINEIMASNTSTIQDNTGAYSDWIEIYNAGPTQVDLANYYITDAISNLTKFRFTSIPGQVVVPAGGYLMVWASGNTAAGNNHTNFSLSSTNGEYAYLVFTDGTTIIDGFAFSPQRDDVSYGRNPDGSITLKYFSPASPNMTNNPSHAYDGFLDKPSFSQNGGFFNSPFNLNLTHSDPTVSIYYTTDGSEPSSSNIAGTTYSYKNSFPENPGDPFGSFLNRSFTTFPYSSPIPIDDRTSSPNEISNISSTWHLSPYYFPSFNIKKGTVVRAVANKPGFLSSDIITNTYIQNASGSNPYTFPIVSVAMQENFLFDYNSGIYTAGKTFDDWRIANPSLVPDICVPGNYSGSGSAWERRGNLELIESVNSVLNQPLGYRIHGSCSPTNPYKSLRAYGTNKFNNYPFFPEYPTLLHERIIFRNSGNDFNQTMFKDAFVHRWFKNLRFSGQKSRPSIMFLNGEYWGIFNIRERIDRYYCNALFGVNPDNLDIRQIVWDGPAEIEEGDGVHYDNMYNFITNNDMSIQANFDQAMTMLDPDNLIDYQAAEIYVGNIDWPQNNVRLWRTRNAYNPNVKYNDGRWRWIFFDVDRSLGEVVNYENLDLEMHLPKPENLLFKKLLDNTNFKNAFISRYADLLNSTFKSSFGSPIYSQMRAQYAVEAPAHIQRWKNLPDMAAWNAQCDLVANYVANRNPFMFFQIKQYFGIDGTYNLTVETPDTSKGYIRVNTLAVTNGTDGMPSNLQSWTGEYFDNIPINITAVPKFGYKFSHWIYNGNQINDSTISILTSTNRTYTAYFDIAIISNNPQPAVSKTVANCGYFMNEWSASSTAGSSPPNSKFVYLNSENPGLNSKISGFTSGSFNLGSRTRINGLENNGFSFINTSDGNEGYPGNKLGGFLVAINTENLDSVKIGFIARTITPNPRKYKIRLYYREGDIQPFQDFSPVIEYTGNTTAGHFQEFQGITLPQSVMNKPYVQLFWKYYYTGLATSGARDQLALDDIKVLGKKVFSGTLTTNQYPGDLLPAIISNTGTVNPTVRVENSALNSITLLPGFEAKNNSYFKAEIKTCN